jgi:hypothetical protein
LKTDPCTGRLQLHVVWGHWKSRCHWIISITFNAYGRTRWRLFCSNVQGIFRRQGQWNGEATCDRRQIWQRVQKPWPNVTS